MAEAEIRMWDGKYRSTSLVVEAEPNYTRFDAGDDGWCVLTPEAALEVAEHIARTYGRRFAPVPDEAAHQEVEAEMAAEAGDEVNR
jgi:hypothetical protein